MGGQKRRSAVRLVFLLCGFAGILLTAAFAPSVGVQTPVPGLGVEGDGKNDVGGGPGTSGAGGDGGSSGDGSGQPSDGESETEDQPPDDGESGVDSYGGVSAGGYPEQTTVGGETELSNHEELVVESPRRSRWRLGAYTSYTGDGWRRSDDRQPLTEPLPTADGSKPAYEIRVTPRRELRTLATAPRPAFADVAGRQVFTDRERAFTVDEPIPVGEPYGTVSYGPAPREAAVASDGGAPPVVENRYTQLPEDTPDRLTDRTADITADADTPYEAASAVEEWLEANKTYSLNASHDRSGDVADEFVFEMDAGYCQYFATAMVAMLRTQDVPARYVTGYSPGEQVGDDEYLVRGRNAHAWVEVYVADVGWVTFDPTPGDGRRAAGRGDPPATEPQDSETTELDVELTPDPVPGREVTTTVARGGEPLEGATVLFNGEAVGETDSAGNVTGRVPYNQSLEVEVRTEEPEPRLVGVGSAGAGRRAAVGQPRLQTADNGSVTFEVPTEITVQVSGELTPQTAVKVEATIAGDPVRDGEVRLDGQPAARTDEEGRATVELPDAETVDLVVERGDARGNRTLNLTRETPGSEAGAESGPLELSVSTSMPLPVPGDSATIAVGYGGDPIPNATVAVAGEPVGETGPNGTLAAGLPIAAATTVSASATVDDGETVTGETIVENLYRNAALLGGGFLLLVGGSVALLARLGVTPGLLVTIGRLLVSAVVTGVVGVAGLLDTGLVALLRWSRRVVTLLGDGLQGAVALCVATAVGARRAVRRVFAGLRSLLRRLRPRAIWAALLGLRRSASESVAAVRDGTPAGDATVDGADGDEALPTVEEVWAEFREYVTITPWRTSTPGEIARWAVDRDGLPRGAVTTLRDAFREVEYGARSADDRAPDARRALREIRDSRRDHGGEEES